MILYKTISTKLNGSSYKEVLKKALKIYHEIDKRTKRSAYFRSPYFNNEKIFINIFWEHLNQKSPRDRIRRLKFLPCAFELISNSNHKPSSKINPNNTKEILHRFGGVTQKGELFYV